VVPERLRNTALNHIDNQEHMHKTFLLSFSPWYTLPGTQLETLYTIGILFKRSVKDKHGMSSFTALIVFSLGNTEHEKVE
jgi:hypothetical protein